MRALTAVAMTLMAAGSAPAHFVYILPGPEGVRVVFSDRLGPDEKVPIGKIEATRLVAVDARGGRKPLEWEKREHALAAGLGNPRPVLVGGVTEYGFAQSRHTRNKPVRLRYYPKAILGDPAGATDLRLGAEAPFEIVPVVREGRLGFRALRGDEPLAGVACVAIHEGGGDPQRLTTDAEGMIPAKLDRPGRYGIWLKVVEPGSGESGGKAIEEFHSIVTLTFEVGEGPGAGR